MHRFGQGYKYGPATDMHNAIKSRLAEPHDTYV